MPLNKIDPRQLAEDVATVKFYLSKGFYAQLSCAVKDKIIDLDSLTPLTLNRTSLEGLLSQIAIEQTLAVYSTVVKTLNNEHIFNFSNQKDATVGSAYALYAGTLAGLKRLEDAVPEDVNMICFQLNFDDSKTLFKTITERYGQLVQTRNIESGRALAALTKSVLSGIKKEAQSVFERYGELANRLNIVSLEVDGIVLDGLDQRQIEEQTTSFNMRWDELVGVDETAATLRLVAKQIAFYDPKTQHNPEMKVIPSPILLYGKPGTGKTSLIKAVATEMQQLAEYRKMPFRFRMIDNADKSKWMGESVALVRKKVQEIQNPGGIGLLVIDDCDMVLSSRSSEGGENFAEEQILHEIMTEISGLSGNYLGNYLWIFASNFPENIDEALRSRIKHKTEITGLTTPEHYAKLLTILTETEIKNGYITANKNDLYELGTFCKEINASGRTVNNLVSVVTGLIYQQEPPLELFKLSVEDMWKKRQEMYRHITTAEMKPLLKSLVDEELKTEQEGRSRKIRSIADDMIHRLKAQEYVRRLFERSIVEPEIGAPPINKNGNGNNGHSSEVLAGLTSKGGEYGSSRI